MMTDPPGVPGPYAASASSSPAPASSWEARYDKERSRVVWLAAAAAAASMVAAVAVSWAALVTVKAVDDGPGRGPAYQNSAPRGGPEGRGGQMAPGGGQEGRGGQMAPGGPRQQQAPDSPVA